MSHINCICGSQTSDVGFPSKNQGHVITDIEYDALPETIRVDNIGWGMTVWECWGCGRVAFEKDGKLVWYTPDNGKADLFGDSALNRGVKP